MELYDGGIYAIKLCMKKQGKEKFGFFLQKKIDFEGKLGLLKR